jgi:hypothetical protein
MLKTNTQDSRDTQGHAMRPKSVDCFKCSRKTKHFGIITRMVWYDDYWNCNRSIGTNALLRARSCFSRFFRENEPSKTTEKQTATAFAILCFNFSYTTTTRKDSSTLCASKKRQTQSAILIGGIRSWLPIYSLGVQSGSAISFGLHANRFTRKMFCIAYELPNIGYTYRQHWKNVFFRNTKSHKGVCPNRKTWFFHIFGSRVHWRPEMQLSGRNSLTHVKPVPHRPGSGYCQLKTIAWVTQEQNWALSLTTPVFDTTEVPC